MTKNNYFENTDADKLRIFIDLDGKVEMDEKEFNKLDKSIIKVLKSIEDISIITSSNYKSEKWVDNELHETYAKLSYRITYINEYCNSMSDVRNIVVNEKQKELKELFEKNGLSIGTNDETLNIDTSVYRNGMGKIRCVNAYKHKQQKERINKLIKGEIQDTIITYIFDDCSLKRFVPVEKKKKKEKKEKKEKKK
jgi:hypothetical protein